MTMRETLIAATKDFNLQLSEKQLSQLERYHALLAEWNEKMNLTAITDDEGIAVKHFADSLTLFNYYDIPQNARVIDESKLSADTVQLLSKVTVENMNAKMKMQFQIVGESEADFSKGLLSASTPIGKALIGHSKGEVVEAKVPSGIMKFKILDISL